LLARTDSLTKLDDLYPLLQAEAYFAGSCLSDVATLITIIWNQYSSKTLPEKKQEPDAEPVADCSWAQIMKIDPNKVISVSHGGGLHFIRDILCGKTAGYVSIYPIVGLWVSPTTTKGPYIHRMDAIYATREPQKYFDIPASFSGEIKAKYLYGNIQNVSYEAIIPSKNVKHIKNLSFRLHKPNFGNMKSVAWSSVKETLSKYPDLYKRVFAHVRKLEESL
jgi:hypothetical protein